jgi:Raf kinase inhibitor-like YbhB/YbcL family protein
VAYYKLVFEDNHHVKVFCRVYTGIMQNVAWTVTGIGFFILLGALYLLPVKIPNGTTTPAEQPTTMIIRSPAFNHEETIPSKYTCEGDDVSPPLAFDTVPQGTVSLVLIMDDPDAPNGTWDHWVRFNIPVSETRIGEEVELLGMGGKNSWGSTGYGGPCPPSGEHRYLFKLYALDTMLTLSEGTSKEEVLVAMQGHVLESATLMGRYKKGAENESSS